MMDRRKRIKLSRSYGPTIKWTKASSVNPGLDAFPIASGSGGPVARKIMRSGLTETCRQAQHRTVVPNCLRGGRNHSAVRCGWERRLGVEDCSAVRRAQTEQLGTVVRHW